MNILHLVFYDLFHINEWLIQKMFKENFTARPFCSNFLTFSRHWSNKRIFWKFKVAKNSKFIRQTSSMGRPSIFRRFWALGIDCRPHPWEFHHFSDAWYERYSFVPSELWSNPCKQCTSKLPQRKEITRDRYQKIVKAIWPARPNGLHGHSANNSDCCIPCLNYELKQNSVNEFSINLQHRNKRCDIISRSKDNQPAKIFLKCGSLDSVLKTLPIRSHFMDTLYYENVRVPNLVKRIIYSNRRIHSCRSSDSSPWWLPGASS